MKSFYSACIGACSAHRNKNRQNKTLPCKGLRLDAMVLMLLLSISSLVLSPAYAKSDETSRDPLAESLVVRCASSCDAIASTIKSLGGTVNVRYANVDALAIKVPSAVVDRIATIAGVSGVGKDRLIALPYPFEPLAINSSDVLASAALTPAELGELLDNNPANYNFNNRLTGASALHQAGQFGEGVVVAVIDSGIANNPGVVHSLFGNVIGGENFVQQVDEPSATSTFNDSHGTMVATMIAGHGAFDALNSSPLVQAVLAYAPDSVLPLNPSASTIPLVGTAPAASLYALKVFPADGGGARASTVLAAMDRALSLKRNFDAGQPVVPVSGTGLEEDPFVYDALNIRVVNLSLGGETLIPGLGLEDVLALEMLANGITVVAASGNEGPASLTGGSPGTSVAALSVGAANSAAHERIWLDAVVAPGFGSAYRANDALQMAEFSSRGPTADGRRGVDVVANGMGNFVQGADGGFYLVAGTSFSAPTVAGAAALLRGASPAASATAIRSALIKSADDDALEKSAMKIDQGRGFLDVPAALALLNKGKVDDSLPRLPRKPRRSTEISKLIEDLDIEPIELEDHKSYSKTLELLPGEVEHLLVPTDDETAAITVTVSNIQPELPIDQQNQLYGDDIYLTVVDAPTSYNDVLASEFLFEDTQFVFEDPQHGLLRLAVMGDFTNAGKVKAKITISAQEKNRERAMIKQRIRDGQFDSYVMTVEPGTSSANFELSWKGDWGRYPANDLDLILVDPNGDVFFDGATLRVPEKVSISDPAPGMWNVIVDGFELHGLRDHYELRAVDGAGGSLPLVQ